LAAAIPLPMITRGSLIAALTLLPVLPEATPRLKKMPPFKVRERPSKDSVIA
jgi:hypothetical protein